VKALIADDDRGTLAVLEKALKHAGLDVVAARDGATAWELLNTTGGISVAIVDWMMPGMDGLQLCRRIRQHAELATMYVILLTGRDGSADLVAGLEAGADDYIVKPFVFDELQARTRVGIRVAALQQRLAVRVEELKAAHDKLERLASTDALTGLYCRRRWYEFGADEIARHQRYKRPFSVLVADLDYFKRVNDTFGHAVGDDVLARFSQVLRDQRRESDVVGRVGGEEFALLLPEATLADAREVGTRIVTDCRLLKLPTSVGEVTFTCSIGAAEVTAADRTIENIVQRADEALYRAKHQGRNQVAA
jgi:two-component system, cell cycle response regulator